ncbi:transglutaminase family protein [Sphingomonas sp. CLY1604]|uniref:transglutaminase family protein n=1 Tax=Sphingomonas sp. CLY1604 TaxID=3457786 RepID=UPI003FD8D4BE
MILTVAHRTTYRYSRAVALQPHRLMLCPRGQHDLRLVNASIECTPSAEIEWTQDVFGNLIATARFDQMSDALVIDSRIVVDQSAPAWPIFKIALSAHRYPFSYSPEEANDLGALCFPQHPDAADSVRAWVAGFRGAEPAIDTLTLLNEINAGIAGQFSYVAREEEGTQAPHETIRLGSGSCRDFATLFTEAVRLLGFGARAVSGYLRTGEDGEHGQHGSTHAWAEVYLPCAGWIAFDPTHARLGGADLIPVAVARTIEQILPVQGSYTGARQDFVGMTVEVAVTAGHAGA